MAVAGRVRGRMGMGLGHRKGYRVGDGWVGLLGFKMEA
jgi:hypothetical protein